MREADGQTDMGETRGRRETEVRRGERVSCAWCALRGCTCHIADRGKAPGDRR